MKRRCVRSSWFEDGALASLGEWREREAWLFGLMLDLDTPALPELALDGRDESALRRTGYVLEVVARQFGRSCDTLGLMGLAARAWTAWRGTPARLLDAVDTRRAIAGLTPVKLLGPPPFGPMPVRLGEENDFAARWGIADPVRKSRWVPETRAILATRLATQSLGAAGDSTDVVGRP